MDRKQLIDDILSFNTKSFKLRWHKLVAVIKRLGLMPFYKHFGNGRDIKRIPIIINNRNRLTYMLQLIGWLEDNGYTNIYIIDNDSTYPPLLEFYAATSYKVFRLKQNVGHLALWKTGIIKLFKGDYYVYTDPDILPVAECPADVISYFMELLKKYKSIEKVGFGLKTDDLPDWYEDKQKVMAWESRFWVKQVEAYVYDAPLDTTFALYKPFTNGEKWVQGAYRTAGNYMARHLPWYENSMAPTAEDQYYKEHVRAGASHWIDASNA